MQIDRGAYPEARTPWDDPAWRASALGWLDAQLGRIGVREVAPRRVRVRPWSVIVRVEAATPIWFKAAAPGAAFEAGLGADLRRAAELARRLSRLTRAGSWGRLFPDSAHLGDPPRAAALLGLLP